MAGGGARLPLKACRGGWSCAMRNGCDLSSRNDDGPGTIAWCVPARQLRARQRPMPGVISRPPDRLSATNTASLPRAAGDGHSVGVPLRSRLPSRSRSSISRAHGASFACTPNSEAKEPRHHKRGGRPTCREEHRLVLRQEQAHPAPTHLDERAGFSKPMRLVSREEGLHAEGSDDGLGADSLLLQSRTDGVARGRPPVADTPRPHRSSGLRAVSGSRR